MPSPFPGMDPYLEQFWGDVTLDLQALIDQAYLNGGYDEDIDYRAEPVPPLEDDDSDWAAALLRDKGLRPKRPPRNGTRSRKAKR